MRGGQPNSAPSGSHFSVRARNEPSILTKLPSPGRVKMSNYTLVTYIHEGSFVKGTTSRMRRMSRHMPRIGNRSMILRSCNPRQKSPPAPREADRLRARETRQPRSQDDEETTRISQTSNCVDDRRPPSRMHGLKRR